MMTRTLVLSLVLMATTVFGYASTSHLSAPEGALPTVVHRVNEPATSSNLESQTKLNIPTESMATAASNATQTTQSSTTKTETLRSQNARENAPLQQTNLSETAVKKSAAANSNASVSVDKEKVYKYSAITLAAAALIVGIVALAINLPWLISIALILGAGALVFFFLSPKNRKAHRN